MYPSHHDLSIASQDFIASRRSSGRNLRFGAPSRTIVMVGSAAGAFARLAAGVERWARGTGDTERAAEVAAPKQTAAGW
jgi:hypothetical protein